MSEYRRNDPRGSEGKWTLNAFVNELRRGLTGFRAECRRNDPETSPDMPLKTFNEWYDELCRFMSETDC